MVRTLVLVMLGVVAQAARCPAAERTLAAVQGLRDCPGGGVILPGSDACLRLSGGVSAAMAVGTPSRGGAMRRALTRLDASTHVDFDVRAPTGLGPIRVYASVRRRDGQGRTRVEP